MKQALIIFVRTPELGKVKTRLAADIGNEAALKVYIRLLEHTHVIALHANAARFVFYAGSINQQDSWNEGFVKMQQEGDDLGLRMQHAFQSVFQQGFEKVMIIGSDCLELTAEIIADGFESLENNEVVIGPAKDGGYYLLGMRKFYPSLFLEKAWSTGLVFSSTMQDFSILGLSNKVLPELSDVDTVDDLPEGFLNIL